MKFPTRATDGLCAICVCGRGVIRKELPGLAFQRGEKGGIGLLSLPGAHNA